MYVFGKKYVTFCTCVLFGSNGTMAKIWYCTVKYGTVGRLANNVNLGGGHSGTERLPTAKYVTFFVLYGRNGTMVKIRYCTVKYGTVDRLAQSVLILDPVISPL